MENEAVAGNRHRGTDQGQWTDWSRYLGVHRGLQLRPQLHDSGPGLIFKFLPDGCSVTAAKRIIELGVTRLQVAACQRIDRLSRVNYWWGPATGADAGSGTSAQPGRMPRLSCAYCLLFSSTCCWTGIFNHELDGAGGGSKQGACSALIAQAAAVSCVTTGCVLSSWLVLRASGSVLSDSTDRSGVARHWQVGTRPPLAPLSVCHGANESCTVAWFLSLEYTH